MYRFYLEMMSLAHRDAQNNKYMLGTVMHKLKWCHFINTNQ